MMSRAQALCEVCTLATASVDRLVVTDLVDETFRLCEDCYEGDRQWWDDRHAEAVQALWSDLTHAVVPIEDVD